MHVTTYPNGLKSTWLSDDLEATLSPGGGLGLELREDGGDLTYVELSARELTQLRAFLERN